MRQTSLRTATALVLILPALATNATAQLRKDQGGGAPAVHAAPPAPAPHISAPAPAPHIAAPAPQPHIAAPQPHIAAPQPHIAAPQPHIAAPQPHIAVPAHVATPHVATPHVATPQIAHTNVGHANSAAAIAKQHGNAPIATAGETTRRGGSTPANVANSKVATPSKTNAATTAVTGQNKAGQSKIETNNTNKIEPNASPSKLATPNKAVPNTTTPNTATPNAPNAVGQGPGNRGRNAANPNQNAVNQQTQTKAQEQAQARAQIYSPGHKPVLQNPAFADAGKTRDPALRELARATFQGRFAEQFHGRDRDRDRDRFEDRRGFRGLVIGWVGPVFWPYAYEDFVDYTFYPYANDAFWPYAYDDVYDGIFGAYAPYASAYADVTGGRRHTRRYDRGQTIASAPAGVPAGSGAAEVCSGQATGLTDWPIERIAEQVQVTDAQRMLLDQLKDATAKAVSLLQSACPTDLPSTPTGRLAAMRQRIVSMLQAVQIVRPALEGFYRSLSDEQKERFIALGAQGNPKQGNPKVARTANRQQLNPAQACSGSSNQITSLPINQIRQVLHPNDTQQAALDELNNAIAQAANLLKENCVQEGQDQPITPPARLAVMEARLSAMLKALDTVQPAMAKFYNSLTDEQKARFDRLGPRQV
jgi:hypothetical protein